MNKQIDLPIADVQSSPDTRRIAIDRVGIKAIRHPVVVADKNDGVQHTIAVFNMYVSFCGNSEWSRTGNFCRVVRNHFAGNDRKTRNGFWSY